MMATAKRAAKAGKSKKVVKATGTRKVGKQIPAKDLSALGDSIAQEMAKDVKAQTKGASKPFENVVLPEEKLENSGRGARFGSWVLPVLFVVALVAVWMWLVMSSSATLESKTALQNIARAVQTQDVSTFTRHVNVDAVADSVAGQMFVAPEVGDDLPAAVREQLLSMQARFDTMVKPDLVKDLRTEALRYVETGEIVGSGTVPTMLSRLLLDLFGAETSVAEFSGVRVSTLAEDGADAVGTLNITREDLVVDDAVTVVPLQVLLKNTDGAWQVVGLPNLGVALTQIDVAKADMAAAAQNKVAAQMAAILQVEKLTKASVSDASMLVALGLKNTGAQDIVGFSGTVTFTDAGGRIMKEVMLTDTDVIKASTSLAKTWTVPVDTSISAERHVLVLPMDAIKATFAAESISFADGTVLSRP